MNCYQSIILNIHQPTMRCLPWNAKGQRKRNKNGRLEFHMPFCRFESHMLPIWRVMANTRNTNLWDAITTRLGSLVYILTQTPASERTCTVHQVLVESLTACSDPGTCTAPGCLLDSKAIIASICKKRFSRTHSSPNLCCLPWNAKGQRRNHHASPFKM